MSNFNKWLTSRKAGKIPVDPTKVRISRGESPVGITMYPPLNADIRFNIGKYKVFTPFDEFRLRGTLPEMWTNFTGEVSHLDSGGNPVPAGPLENKHKIITKQMNQGLCGSCFCCSCATAISDTFVFNGLNFNPNISPMAMLACAKGDGNAQCSGGQPKFILDFVAQNGIMSNNCLDYVSMCKNDKYCGCTSASCSPPSEDSANEMIPSSCGCCGPTKHYSYKIDPNSIHLASTNTDPHGAEYKIKQWLFDHGSAVAGFIVRKNWVGGDYSLTNGVYVESENYTGNTQDIDEQVGGHAICIVGWGVEKNVKIPSTGKTLDLKYWWVRNSWGQSWGNNGYCKYAMYQPGINETTAFEMIHKIPVSKDDPNDFVQVGGILLFSPGSIDPYSTITDDKTKCVNDGSSDPDYNPNNPPNPTPPTPNNPSDKPKSSGSWNWLWFVLILIMVVLLLFYTIRTD
jgi:hypothetical protein